MMRPMTEEQFKTALEEHRSKHGDPWSPAAVSALQALHLARAGVLEAEGHADGLGHLRAAEDCQWRIGTESTSAAEGTASMAALYAIRARRARLHERLGQKTEAIDLWESIAADPNGLGTFAAPELERLRAP